MSIIVLFLWISYVYFLWFIWHEIGFNLSLTSVLLILLLILHGPMYLYYTRIWGPTTQFFYQILSVAGAEEFFSTMDIAMIFTLVGSCLGVKLADLFSGNSGRDIRDAIAIWPKMQLDRDYFNRRRFHVVLLVIFLFVLLPFAVYEHQVQNIIEYIKSNASEVAKIAFRRDHGGSKIYLYALLCAGFFPFLAFLGISNFKNETVWCKLLITLFVMFLLLAKMATFSKLPPVLFIIQCIVVIIMCYRLTLSFRLFSILFILIFGLFIVVTKIAIFAGTGYNISAIEQALRFLFYRMFMIPNESLMEYFSSIPMVIDFSWGSNISLVTKLLQKAPMPATYWLVGAVHRGSMLSTTNVMFIGDAWATFSWVGVVVFPLIFGALVRTIDRYLLVNRRKTVVTISALALGHYGLIIAISTALQTAFLTGGLLLIFPLVIFFGRPVRKLICRNYVQHRSMPPDNSVG